MDLTFCMDLFIPLRAAGGRYVVVLNVFLFGCFQSLRMRWRRSRRESPPLTVLPRSLLPSTTRWPGEDIINKEITSQYIVFCVYTM